MQPIAPTPLPLAQPRRPALELTNQEWQAWLEGRGHKSFHVKQIRQWILGKGAASFAEMTDVPASLRRELTDAFEPLSTRVLRRLQADDGTHKLLIRLHDRQIVECVLIQDGGRRTACLSTQVGCGMGCVFCASGLDGLTRNLTATEILEQLLHLRNLPPVPEAADHPDARRLTNVVVMGMGEPLANFDPLMEALATVTAKDGLGLGARHVTVSTVGLPSRMRRLADLGRQYHLAVSLHAPNEELRRRIVPTADKTALQDILDAADYFHVRTGRQVTFEYVLLAGVNDEARHAEELAGLLQGRGAHVNLIPCNEVAGLPYRRPSPEALAAFQEPLRRRGISVKVRKRKGSRIEAACGQLRRVHIQESAGDVDGAGPPCC